MSKPHAKSGKKSKSYTNPHARKSANPKHAGKTAQLQPSTRWSGAEELDLIAYNINCDALREELRKAKLEKLRAQYNVAELTAKIEDLKEYITASEFNGMPMQVVPLIDINASIETMRADTKRRSQEIIQMNMAVIKHKHNPTLSVRLLEIARARSALEIDIAEVFEAIKDYNSQRLALEMCCDTLLMTAKVHAQQLKNTTYVSESEDDADIEGLLPVHTQRLPQAHARTHAHTHRAKKNTHKTVIPGRASVRPDAKRSSVLAKARDKGADANHGTDGAGNSEEVILSPNQKQDKGTANANGKRDKAAAPNKNTRKAKRKNEAATAPTNTMESVTTSAVTTTGQAVADKAANNTLTGECGAELESPTSDRDPTDQDTQPANALGKTRAGASSAEETQGVGVGAGGVGHADAPVENSAAPVTYRDNAGAILMDTSDRHNPNHTDNNTQKGSQHTKQNMQKQSKRPTKASGDGMRMGGGVSSTASAGADVDVSGDNWITHRARSKDKRKGVKKRPKDTDKGTAPSDTAATTISACRQARGVSVGVGVDGSERVASETSQTEEAPTVSGPTVYRDFVNMEKHLRDNIARTANTAGQRKMRCHKKGGSRAHSRNDSWIAGADASFDGVLAHESVSVGMSLSRHRQAQAAPVKVFNPAMYSIPRRKDSASDLDVSRNNRSALPFFASSAETSLNMSQPLQELGQNNGSILNGIARPKKKRKLGGGGGSFLL